MKSIIFAGELKKIALTPKFKSRSSYIIQFDLKIRLNAPKGNVLDSIMLESLAAALQKAGQNPDIKCIVFQGTGDHFSFGASVEEHLPGQCAGMLRALHGLILRMVESPLPILVAVRGQCLGGGLEVAAAGSFIFAAADSSLGQPEIKLAVFAWILGLFASMGTVAAWVGVIAGDLTSVLPLHGVAGAGTYEAGVVAALLPFGIDAKIALQAAVNLHLFILGSTLLAGLLSLGLPARRPADNGE